MTRRLRMLFDQLTKVTGMDRQQWILKTVMDEVLEEINDRASEDKAGADALLAEWFSKCGMMLEWVATGNIPEAARNDLFISQVTAPEQVAIDA